MAIKIQSTIKSLEFIMANTNNPFEAELLKIEIANLTEVLNQLND